MSVRSEDDPSISNAPPEDPLVHAVNTASVNVSDPLYSIRDEDVHEVVVDVLQVAEERKRLSDSE